MLVRSSASHHYSSAHKRFVKPSIMRFFETELPKLFGPNLREMITDKLLDIFYSNHVNIKALKAGQILWNAVHKNTRADAPNMKLVPVLLTIIDDEDIDNLEEGAVMFAHRQKVIARITEEAYQQDALLSMRDIGLILTITPSAISKARITYEKKNNITLPHTGNLHDMGTCLTHKSQIVYKSIVEKKDTKIIAKETAHSIKAVDRYLSDFNRIKTLHLDGKAPEYIKLVTRMPTHVIMQYIKIIEQYVKEQKN